MPWLLMCVTSSGGKLFLPTYFASLQAIELRSHRATRRNQIRDDIVIDIQASVARMD